MVLERSFDSAELKQLLSGNDMLMDRSLATERRNDPTRICRPPLPKGSHVFEKVLDEFQPERLAPEIKVTAPAAQLKPNNKRSQKGDSTLLSPGSPRVRSRCNSPAPRSRPGSAWAVNSPQGSRPNSAVKERAPSGERAGTGSGSVQQTLSPRSSKTQLASSAMN